MDFALELETKRVADDKHRTDDGYENQTLISTEAKTEAEKSENLSRIKEILAVLREKHPERIYPTDSAIDSLLNIGMQASPLVFDFIFENNLPVAATVGVRNNKDFELRWVFSSQSGMGIRLIKEAMNKYDFIELKASPYGYKQGEQSIQLEKIVSYYKTLGFRESPDYKDEKYGGNIPMRWRYNKLMGGRH